MASVDGGELLVRQLDILGLREIFTLHGSHLEPFYQACLNHDLRVIDTRHEQAAAHMADGWARHTGRPAVCAVTAGPGITDAISGVANAMLDGIPMLVIGGRSPLLDDERLPLQSMDQMALMAAVTKWRHSVKHVERIPEIVAMAYRQAVSGRPGPVFIELPVDVLFQQIDETHVRFPQRAAPVASGGERDAIRQALRILHAAARPVILAGGGVFFSRAWEELRKFAEQTNIPVFANAKARGCLPEDHPLAGGAFSTLAQLRRLGEAGRPDAALILGARLGMFTGASSDIFLPHDATLIQVDIEPEEIGRNREIALGISGDCRAVLQQLIAESAGGAANSCPEWVEGVQQIRRQAAARFANTLEIGEGLIHPHRLMTEIAASVPEDTTFVADGGETADWLAGVVSVRQAGQWLSHGYLGCLGIGIPFALACKAANSERCVICVIGDGAMGLNLAELHTAVKHQLTIIVVVSNDQGWGMSRHAQEILYGPGRNIAVDLGPVAYEKVAAAFGAHSELVEEASEIGPALQRALASGRVACLNVMTDPAAVHPFTRAAAGALTAPVG